jgi:hypothetical protein
VTEDGYVVFTTDTGVLAAPVAGGAATVLVDLGSGAMPIVMVVHNDVFIWVTSPTTGGTVGALTVWNHTLVPTPTQLTDASFTYLAAASVDSSNILYSVADTSSVFNPITLYAATTSTLTSPVSLASSIYSEPGCIPAVAFTGTAAPFTAIASFCVAGDDGGMDYGPNNVFAYPTSTWKATQIAADANTMASPPFSVDKSGDWVVVALGNGGVETVPLGADSATAVPIAGSGTLPDVPEYVFDPAVGNLAYYLSKTDAFVLYATGKGALVRSPVTTSTPTTLVGSNVNGLDGLSPDESWQIVNKNTDPSNGLPTDLSIASTATPATPTKLTGSSTSDCGVLGDPFTADSTFALFMTDIVDGANSAVGTLHAVSTSDTAVDITVTSSAVMASNYSPVDLALTKTQIVYADSFDSSIGTAGGVTVNFVDVATKGLPTVLVAGVNPSFFVSFDKKRVLYTINAGGSTDGIYSVAVP